MDPIKEKEMKPKKEKKPIDVCYNYDFTDKLLMGDLDNRHLLINDEIDASTIDIIVFHIIRYNKMDKGIPVDERKPILLFMNTVGGSVFDGFGVVDAIQRSVTPVYTINIALCASLGFDIFIAGKKRFAMPHSVFLMHDGATMMNDSTAKTKDVIDFICGQFAESTKQYVVDNTGISSEAYDDKYRKEWFFMADEAKRLHVVDYIIGEDYMLDDIL